MAKSPTSSPVRTHQGVNAWQSLQFKLGMLFLLALILLGGGAYWASRSLVEDQLVNETSQYEQESGLRLAAELRTLLGDSQALALTLAQLAASPDVKAENLRNAGPQLLKGRALLPLVANLGIWPETPGAAPGSDRSSLFWAKDASGTLTLRNDYNDPRTTPYTREKWFTPGRYAPEGTAYWTGLRKETIGNRSVLTCVVPIQIAGRFAGVATVSLDSNVISERFAAIGGSTAGYSLLVDDSLQVLGIAGHDQNTAVLGKAGRTLAELAKATPSYAPMTVALYKQAENAKSKVLASARYDAKLVSALKEGSRDMSRQEAEDALLGLWALDQKKDPEADATLRTLLEQDPVLGEPSAASYYKLRTPPWTLIRVTPAQAGYSGANYLFKQSLAVTLSLSALTLLLAFLALRIFVIHPLRVMARQLSRNQTPEEALNLVLDASSRDEVGMIAHWQNERIRQLRDAMDNVQAAQSQLTSESRERKSAQEQLSRARERTALALQSVSDAVIITDEAGNIDDMNAAAESLCGIALREVRHKPLMEAARLRRPDAPGELANPVRLTMERAARVEWDDNITLEPFTGSPREIILKAAPIRARNQVVGAVLVMHERIRREAANGDLVSTLTRHQQDLLTGLPGRATLDRRIASLLDRIDDTHAVAYVDVDHLKKINDSGGQAAGDDVLVRVAETLMAASPEPHEVYRIAADQFVVIYGPLQDDEAMPIAEQLRERLANTRFYWESRHFSVTASIGVSIINSHVPNAIEAVRRADDACAAAKRAGRNNVQLYDPRMDRLGRSVDDESWVGCIRRGLEDNLFHLRTQWIMPGKDYAAEGHCYEVLLALEDSEGFWAAPAAFMPVAERHHMTTAIDRWVIRNTLEYLEQQPKVVETLSFCSINLSTATLASPDFLDFIAACLEKQPHLATQLCFELREDALTDHPREAALCCDVLHRMGCKISVDHYFGRHISELTQLRKLPVDFVKVDAQGFKNLASDPVEQMLAESVLRIVRHLRRRVIVNNIDDAKTLEIWRKLGADYFQGYAFAKPSPVAFLAPD